MKSLRRKGMAFLLSFLMVLMSFGSASPVLGVTTNPTLSLTPSTTTPTVDQIFTVDVEMTNVPTINGAQVTVYYDPTKLQVVTSTGGTPTFFTGTIRRTDMYSIDGEGVETGIFTQAGANVNNASGLLDYSLYIHQDQKEIVPPYPVTSEPFKILTIRFKAIALGDPQLRFAVAGVSPQSNPANPTGYIVSLSPTAGDATVTVSNPTITIVAAPDNTALAADITAANTLLAGKTVGTAVGNVSQSAYDAYQAAITTATGVKDASGMTQTDYDNAQAALTTATAAFNSAVIPQGSNAALASAITTASALALAKNVGSDVGNVSQAAKDAYQTAIDTATAASSAVKTQAEYDAAKTALDSATTTFNSAILTQGSNSLLAAAISTATTTANSTTTGTAVGQVPQSAKDDYLAAIATAETVSNAVKTQAQYDAAKAALDQATQTFSAAIVGGGSSVVLAAAITDATTLITGTTVGTGAGQVPQAAKDAYQTAINTATAVKNSTVTQAEYDAAKAALDSATTAFNNAIVPQGNNTALATAIADATAAKNAVTVGTATGQVSQTAMDAYTSAIADATAVKDAVKTQAEYDTAAATLATATSAFQSAIVSDLPTVIAAAQAAISGATVGTDVGQYPQTAYQAFQAAISSAVAVNATGTPTDKAAAVTALQTAQATFLASINKFTITNPVITRTNGITATATLSGTGNGAMVFQLMKDTNTVIGLYSIKGYFNNYTHTVNFNNYANDSTYWVKVFVFDELDSSATSIGRSLADPMEIKENR